MIGSTRPRQASSTSSTPSVAIFGGAASLLGTIASAFSISQTQSTLEFFMSVRWQGAELLAVGRNSDAAAAGSVRLKVRK